MERRSLLIAVLGLSVAACTGTTDVEIGSSTEHTSDPQAAQPGPPQRTIKADGRVFAQEPVAPSAPVACPSAEAPFAGCVVTHDVGFDSFGDVKMTCGSDKQASNGCKGNPVMFGFDDPAGMRAMPAAITIAFDTALFCAAPGMSVTQTVELNGMPVGTFEGDPADCSCEAPSKERFIRVSAADLRFFKPNEKNIVGISGWNDCLAIRPNAAWSGAYARIVVRY